MQECSLQTEIRTLGPCKLDSVLPYRTWADNKTVQIVVDEELSDEVGAPVSVCLEAAGPRKKLYFDTTRAKCAIVTCGGLCPGINDVIRAIVMTLEWYARLDVESRFPEAETFLRRFMEVLYSAEEKGLATLPTFLEHWRAKSGEEKVPMPETMDAVRVMTIHKSKGLEAPVVVVPWTDLRARMGQSTVMVEREGLRMAVGNKKHLGAPYHEEMARQCRENVHLLYVAFTRARDALYVLRTSTIGGRGSTSDALELLMAEAGYTAPYAVGDAPAPHA